MKSYLKFLSFAIFSMLIISACGSDGENSNNENTSSGTTTGVTDSTIVIGSFGPLSGPAALWGNIMLGMDAYFKMVNEEGGVNGRTVDFLMKDDGYDPSRTVPIAKELIQKEEVFAFVGGIGTAPCMAVMDGIVEENIPWISPITGATHWSIPQKKNIFSVLPYYIDEGIIQAKYAVDSLGSSKIGIIYQNDDVGKSGLLGAKDFLKTKNLDFIVEVPVETTDTDLTSHIAKLKSSGADVVLLWTLPRQGIITVKTAKVVSFNPQFIASFILSDQAMMHHLSEGDWEGVIYGSFAEPPYNLENAEITKYKNAMAKYYPDVTWGIFPYAGFLYARPFVEALKGMGKEVSREGLIQAMEALNVDIMGVNISYSPTKRQALRSMRLLKCTGSISYEGLSDYITSDSDIETLAKELEDM